MLAKSRQVYIQHLLGSSTRKQVPMTDNFTATEATMTVIILCQRTSSPSDCHLFPAAMRKLDSHIAKNDSEAVTVVTRRMIKIGVKFTL